MSQMDRWYNTGKAKNVSKAMTATLEWQEWDSWLRHNVLHLRTEQCRRRREWPWWAF